MSTKQRLFALPLSAAILFTSLSFAGCKDNSNPPDDEGRTETQILTNVFRGADLALPDGFYINQRVDMAYQDGRMKMICETTKQVEDEYVTQYCLYEVGLDGSDPVVTELSLGEGDAVSWGTFTDDGLIFQNVTLDEANNAYSYDLVSYVLSDQSRTVIGNLTTLFPSAVETGYSNLMDIAADGEGYIYLTTRDRLCVLDPSSGYVCEIDPPTAADGTVLTIGMNCLQRASDGTVWLSALTGLLPIDREKRAYGDPILPPGTVQARQFFFGPGYDFYYSNREGLYGYTDGMETGELVLNWTNSNLIEDNIQFLQILTPEMVLVGDGNGINLLKRAADIDLNELVTIDVAYVSSDYLLEGMVKDFNQTSESVRVILTDYSEYNTEENPTGGTTKLANDILNGLYRPDIVTAEWKSALVSALLTNGAYVDLYPYIDADDAMCRDDLFGCVKRTFTVDEQLAAICNKVSVQTLLANPETFGERTTWTLDEMLDFAMTLEGDQVLMENLTQKIALSELLGPNGYSAFIDMENHTCNFTSATFTKLLSYLSSLPKHIKSNSENAVLKWKSYSQQESIYTDIMAFGTEEVVRVGYPTNEGSGSMFNASYCYLITKQSAHPAEAWEFLRSMLLTGETYSTFSALKPRMIAMMQKKVDSHTQLFYSSDDKNGKKMTRSVTWSGKNPWKLDENGRLDTGGTSSFEGSQGLLVDYTMEPVFALMDWLDTVGTPIKAAIPEEVSGIVDEEISAYLGGARDADRTAEIIQSRVSLWLSEHS